MRIAIVSLAVLGVLVLVCPAMAFGLSDCLDAPALTIADQSEVCVSTPQVVRVQPVIPEPSGLLAVAAGVGGVLGFRKKIVLSI